MKKAAHQEGYENGRNQGALEAKEELTQIVKPLYEHFEKLLQEFEGVKHELYEANESLIVQMVFAMGREILLRELKTDQEYIQRLAAEVIEKIGAKDYVKIKVNSEDFRNMDTVRDFLKVQFPDLKNIQFEAVDDLPIGGCKVETELSRINAGIENQLIAVRTAMEGL